MALRMVGTGRYGERENFALEKGIIPKSPAQKEYIDAIQSSDMVFGIGPAGTGKTYLGMAMAVEAFSQGLVNRIVLTRPVVEAGEALGFLPGDISKKVDPYLRPFYDALHDLVGFEKVSDLIERGIIEVAPIAFMRGRTLNDSFVMLDEAQNTTSEQMKMFLTRIGFGSKAVITGDITQSDLPIEKPCGLIEAKNILQDIEEIKFIFFSKKDVVRHGLVREIIKTYEELERVKLELEQKRQELQAEIDRMYQELLETHVDSLRDRPHFEKHSRAKLGKVYVLTNDSMPGLVKIGFTRGDPNDRADQISEQHDLKSPFLVKGYVPTIGPYIVEQLVHIELTHLRESGEFFRIDSDEALSVVRKYAEKPPEKI
jgi:hypothetical protein